MRFSTYLNNAKCMEWQIKATQGILFSLLYEAPAWAKEEIIENKTYYFVSSFHLCMLSTLHFLIQCYLCGLGNIYYLDLLAIL